MVIQQYQFLKKNPRREGVGEEGDKILECTVKENKSTQLMEGGGGGGGGALCRLDPHLTRFEIFLHYTSMLICHRLLGSRFASGPTINCHLTRKEEIRLLLYGIN